MPNQINPTARLARRTIDRCLDPNLDLSIADTLREMDDAELVRAICDEVEAQAEECRIHPGDYTSDYLARMEVQWDELRRFDDRLRKTA